MAGWDDDGHNSIAPVVGLNSQNFMNNSPLFQIVNV